jgi:membrane-associated phospholipid phosphatase
MEGVLQWGLDFIRLIQSFANPPLTAVMRIFTGLGSSAVCVILLSLLYWCYDEKKGLRLGLALLISVWLNLTFKLLLNQPRPFFPAYDPAVGMIPEQLGGLPSGHAQNSLVMWTIIASWGRRKRFFAAAAVLCLLISFSRIYLGVHFPSDILGGWLLGGAVLFGYFLLVPHIEALLERGGFRAKMYAASAAAFIMILYRPADEALMGGGLFFGMAAGYNLNKRYIGFKSAGVSGRSKAAKYAVLGARFFLGIAGMVLVFAASGKILHLTRQSDFYYIFYFIRLVIAALWVSAGAPWLFRVFRLAGAQEAA